MYQFKVGSVFVHPDNFEDVTNLGNIAIPEAFDSILVNGTHYIVRSS